MPKAAKYYSFVLSSFALISPGQPAELCFFVGGRGKSSATRGKHRQQRARYKYKENFPNGFHLFSLNSGKQNFFRFISAFVT